VDFNRNRMPLRRNHGATPRGRNEQPGATVHRPLSGDPAMNQPPSNRRPGALQAPLTVAAALAAAAFLTAAGDTAPALDFHSMETFMTATTTLALQTPHAAGWLARWRARLTLPLAALLPRRARFDRLYGLDARLLADIGLDASEIGSVESEARCDCPLTRQRIVRGSRHA
jgi:hypothetical protein